MLYYQSMHDETLRKNDKKKNIYLIRVHIFFANFLIESHYLDHPLFKQTFFVKNFFFFSNMVYFFYQLSLFQTEHHHPIFFLPIFVWHSKIFFRRMTNTTVIFSIFLFFIQNKASSYFEKEIEWKTIFLYFFFKNSKHTFWQVRKNFFKS